MTRESKKTNLKTTLKTFAVIATCAIALTACETAEQNSTAQALTCVNNAAKLSATDPVTAATNATACEAITSKLVNSAEAAKIGFSAVLLMSQKFSQIQNLVNALKQTNNTLATGFTFLIFAGGSGNIGDPNYTKMQTYANRSANIGILEVWSIFSTANLIASLGSLTATPTQAQVTTAVAALNPANANISGTPENALATAVLTAQQNACSGSGSSSTTCAALTKAIGSGATPSSVISALQAYVAAGN